MIDIFEKRNVFEEAEIFHEIRDIVGMLTDNYSAIWQAEEAKKVLEEMKLTKNELLRVFLSGAGFLTAKHDRMTKDEIRTQIVEHCLISFDIDLEELEAIKN